MGNRKRLQLVTKNSLTSVVTRNSSKTFKPKEMTKWSKSQCYLHKLEKRKKLNKKRMKQTERRKRKSCGLRIRKSWKQGFPHNKLTISIMNNKHLWLKLKKGMRSHLPIRLSIPLRILIRSGSISLIRMVEQVALPRTSNQENVRRSKSHRNSLQGMPKSLNGTMTI